MYEEKKPTNNTTNPETNNNAPETQTPPTIEIHEHIYNGKLPPDGWPKPTNALIIRFHPNRSGKIINSWANRSFGDFSAKTNFQPDETPPDLNLYKLIEQAMSPENLHKHTDSLNGPLFINTTSIININDNKEYYIESHSELGENIIKHSGFAKLLKTSNEPFLARVREYIKKEDNQNPNENTPTQ